MAEQKTKIRNSAEHFIRFEHVYRDVYHLQIDGKHYLAVHSVDIVLNKQDVRTIRNRITVLSEWDSKSMMEADVKLAKKIRDRAIEISDGSDVDVQEATRLILGTMQAPMRIESAESDRRRYSPTVQERKEERDRIIAFITHLVTEKGDLVNARAWAELYKIPQTEVDDIAFRRTRNVRNVEM